MTNRTCLVDDCQRRVRANGYCHRHAENLRMYGDPIPQRDWTLETRLNDIGWDVTDTGCWEWKGKRNDCGYGLLTATRLGLRDARAHRVVYEHVVGPIPGGQLLRHICDNPPCVNPDHLIPGTQADNVLDMVARGRHWRYGRTYCDNGHDLTTEGAVRTRQWKGRKENICVACARDRNRAYRLRKRTQSEEAALLG